MSGMAAPRFALSSDGRALAGVCAGIARSLGLDPTLVRLVFAVLALAGGAGVVLYLTFWAHAKLGRPLLTALLGLAAGSLLLLAVGFGGGAVVGTALVAGGLALALRRGGSFRPDAPVSYGGLALAAVGAMLLLPAGDAPTTVIAPGAVVGALLLIAGPVLWRLALDRDAERAARIRSEERAEVASRVHDSVLQTLALIQRHASEPQRVGALARRQERDLRGWLYGDRPLGDDAASLEAALSAAAAEVEELHGVRVELASAGDCPVDETVRAVVLATREAMTNAAKFAQVDVIDVYAEATGDEVAVFVRDRGAGFDRAAVPADRRGLRESIERRLQRAGGRATVVSAPGEGTEVELRVPRRTS
jgi:signal transduction histidine kinase